MGARPGLAIRLLGGFDVEVAGRAVPARAWSLRKGADLVKILALTPGHRLHREQLMEALWPDKDPDAAANNLYQAVHAARNALGREGPHPWIEVRAGLVAFAGDDLWVDVEAFEAAAATPDGDRQASAVALALYRGELLPEDRYEEWPVAQREALAATWRRLARDEAAALQGQGRLGEALVHLRGLLAADSADEDAAREVMRLQALAGDRAGAARTFEALRAALEAELGVSPSAPTTDLHREIVEGRLGPPIVAAARDNLPVALTSFIGRESLASDVRSLLESARLVTLTGTGGTGKTRLAVEVGRSLVPAFADGAWLVELAAVGEPAGVNRAVGDALGVREPPGQTLRDAIVDQVAAREMLLIVDNCEHLIEACAELVATLLTRCPSLRVLATSRQPLRIDGETVFRVPSLAIIDPSGDADVAELASVDAVALFMDRARAVDPAFALTEANARDVAELCYHLDGLPLAIELAASRVAQIPVAELARRLPERFRLLVGGNRAALTRQQTLKATLDWSYDLLSPELQRVLDRISIFASGATVGAAEAVCALPPIDRAAILPILGELAEQSLLILDTSGPEARYRELETVREYGRERLLDRAETGDLGTAHTRWAIALTEAAATGRAGEAWPEAFRRVASELDDLRAALERSIASEPESALQLATNLWAYWLWDGHLVEGRSWLEAALAAVPARTSLRARALVGLCALAGRAGDTTEHARRGTEAVEIARELGDAGSLVWALQALGIAYWASDHDDLAVTEFEAAAEAGRAGFPAGEAAALHALAAVRWTIGDRAAARSALELALAATAALPGTSEFVPPAIDIAFEVVRPDPVTALPWLAMEENATGFRETPPATTLGYVLATRGTMARLEGDPEAARRDFTAALELFRSRADQRGTATIEARLGTLDRDSGALDAARDHLGAALAIRTELADARGVSVTQALLGDLDVLSGNLDDGERLLRRSLEAARARADRWNIAAALSYLVSLSLARGDLEDARQLLDDALAVSRPTGRVRHGAWIHFRRAAIERHAGADPAPHAAAAAAIFKQLGDLGMAAAARDLGRPD
jgi:predicted ATPase/DNA-binding SARP family transcriptional activator